MTSLATHSSGDAPHRSDHEVAPSAPREMRGHADVVIQGVMRVQQRLQIISWLRYTLVALAGGVASWLVLRLALRSASSMQTVVALMLAVLVAAMLVLLQRLRVGAINIERAALWIEEHGAGDFAIATWVEQWRSNAPRSPLLSAMVATSAREPLASAQAALPRVARTQLTWPTLFVVLAALVSFVSNRESVGGDTSGGALRDAATNPAAARAVPIGAWRVRVTPPAYTGQSVRELGDVTSVRALAGSRLTITGTGALPDRVTVHSLADSLLPTLAAVVVADGAQWKAELRATGDPLEVRVLRERFARLLLVEGIADSLPRATLTAPARDSVLRRAVGMLPLSAKLHDDLGLSRAEFEVVVSTGDGEKFTVRTQHVAARTLGGAREAVLQGTLDLAAMQLGPGDMVHVRALARDAHPAANREAGSSETRSFRVARPSEYDSVAVEPAPPPEVDKSLLSQRMLLLLTERLDKKRPQLPAEQFRDESRKLARDQGRLRQAVGDAVFQRLTGEAGGEHSHSADDGHDHGVEAIGGKLALSGVNSQGMLEEGDDSPVIAINKPLLEAYNAMWDAGRALEQSDPHAAIPFMKIALEAIERARAASRLYLRGKPPAVILDLAKIRLAGKDTGVVNDRTAREMLPPTAARREARLLASAILTASNPLAARDSLALLRLESLSDAPAFASALDALLVHYQSTAAKSDTVDVTDAFLRARRALGGISRIPNSGWSRGGPP